MKVQPQLTGAHARLDVHVPSTFNHALGEREQVYRGFSTPNSLLSASKLCRVLLDLPLARQSHQETTKVPVSRERRHNHLASRDVLRSPGGGARSRGMSLEKLRRRFRTIVLSRACRYTGWVKVTSRTVLLESRSAGTTGVSWATRIAKLPPKTMPPCLRSQRQHGH